MIYHHEKDWDTVTQAQKEEIIRRHTALKNDLRETGKYKFCGCLANASTASCARLHNGELTTQAASFVATREHARLAMMKRIVAAVDSRE